MLHDEFWKTVYFGVERSKVKVASHKNIAGLGLCLDFVALTADRVMFVASSHHDTRWRSQASNDKKIDRVFRAPWRWRHGSVPGRLGQVPASERQRIPGLQTENYLPVLEAMRCIGLHRGNVWIFLTFLNSWILLTTKVLRKFGEHANREKCEIGQEKESHCFFFSAVSTRTWQWSQSCHIC